MAEGLAWAFRKFTDVYAPEEATARAAGFGIWAAENQPAWDYRADKWARAAAESPKPGCPIKGNINNGKYIYHTPWSSNYEQTKINLGNGERWFCDEAEAVSAGWRAVRSR